MGCTGSKYHTLNGDTSGPVDGTSQLTSAPPETINGVSPGTKPGQDTQTSSPPPSPGDSSPPPTVVESQKAQTVRVPPPFMGPQSQDQSKTTHAQTSPPHVDIDSYEMAEPACENVEDKFPPWKQEADQKCWNKTLSNPMPMPNGNHTVAQRFARDVKEESLPNFENTVIIFDWDDTLLCSSALHCCLPNQFVELEEVVEALLLMSMKLGRTMIVTNAMESWIQETAQRFMPRLLPTLERLLIVYARKNYERIWPGDTFAWKRETFRELLNDKFGRYLNLLVVGDSLSEIRAAENVAESLGTTALVKTVKFKAMPSPSDLLGELRTFRPQLGTLVEARYSSTKEFHQDFARWRCPDCNNAGFFQARRCEKCEPMPDRSQNWFLMDALPGDTATPPPGIFAQQAALWSTVPPPNQITTI